MKIIAAVGRMPSAIHTLVVPVFATDRGPRIHSAAKDELPDSLSGVLAAESFTGAVGDVYAAHAGGDEALSQILYVGMGDAEKMETSGARRLGAVVGRSLYSEPRATTILLPVSRRVKAAESACAVAEGLTTGRYKFDRYLSTTPKTSRKPTVHLVATGTSDRAALSRATARGVDLGVAINVCREIGDSPPNELGPVELATLARREGRKAGFKVQVLTEAALERKHMHALLSVAKGSARPARLVVMEHTPARASKKPPIVFVGKAITFDTGGISIKGREGMEGMKYDLCGGAAVIGALVAAARLKLGRRVIGIVAAAENMPGGSATRPGDIVTSAAGKSIEIINTDAEGRLVLADALHYAKRLKPALVVDLATLTGACVVALRHYAGVFSPHESAREEVLRAAKEAGEKMWPLPIDDEFLQEMKSAHADLRNSAGRAGGASLAAAFLGEFAPDNWVHIDIAPVSNIDHDVAHQTRGGTGFGVRTLIEVVERAM